MSSPGRVDVRWEGALLQWIFGGLEAPTASPGCLRREERVQRMIEWMNSNASRTLEDRVRLLLSISTRISSWEGIPPATQCVDFYLIPRVPEAPNRWYRDHSFDCASCRAIATLVVRWIAESGARGPSVLLSVLEEADSGSKACESLVQSISREEEGMEVLSLLLEALHAQLAVVPPNYNDEPRQAHHDDILRLVGITSAAAPPARSSSPPSRLLTVPATFLPPLRVLSALCGVREVVRLLPRRLPWLVEEPEGAPPIGRRWAEETLLGRAFTVHPQLQDWDHDGVNVLEAEAALERDEGRISAARQAVAPRLDAGIQEHTAVLHSILLKLFKNKDSREDALEWLRQGLVAHAARPGREFQRAGRSPPGYSFAHTPPLHALGWVCLELCAPFLDPTDARTAGIDIRFVSAAADKSRIARDMSRKVWAGDAVLSSIVLDLAREEGRLPAACAYSSGDAAFVDPRNLARQRQFATRLQRLARELAGGGGGGEGSGGGGGGETASLQPAGDTFSFVTTIFFFTARILHVGLLASLRRRQLVANALSDLRKKRSELVSQVRQAGERRLPEPAGASAEIARLTKVLKLGLAEQYNMELGVAAPRNLERQCAFFRLLAVVLLRAAMFPGGNLPRVPRGESLPIPLPELPLPPPSLLWAALPTHLVEDVGEFLTWLGGHPEMLRDVSVVLMQEFIGFCIAFLASPVHVTNPMVRFKLAQALHTLTPLHFDHARRAELRQGRLRVLPAAELVRDHPLALQSLCPALVRFFVDAEATGTHTQFYDRLQFRLLVYDIIDYVWDSAAHRSALGRFSEGTSEGGTAMKFASFLLNDLNHYREAVLEELHALNTVVAEQASETWGSRSREEREDRERELHRATVLGRNDVSGLQHMLRFWSMVSEAAGHLFLSELLLGRTSQLLCLLASSLHSDTPARERIHCVDPTRVGLAPDLLTARLGKAVGELVHCAAREEGGIRRLAASLAQSEPFFRRDAFLHLEEALLQRDRDADPRMAAQERGQPSQWAAAVRRLLHHMPAEQGGRGEGEVGADEAPDEFLDALLFTLMEDPVFLPTSGATVDRSTIARHLLDSDLDPFTREPLSMEQVVPQPDLKARIDAWRRGETGGGGETGEGTGEGEEEEEIEDEEGEWDDEELAAAIRMSLEARN